MQEAAVSRPPVSESTVVAGPAGALEALWELPRASGAAGAVVVCHPHPQHGGTMQNKVVHTLARAFLAQGYMALRFNYRGVGASAGEWDEGRGELADALAAIDAAAERAAGKPVWLAGFSFGGAIAIRAAAERSPRGLVTIAPAVARLEDPVDVRCPWLIIAPDQDELLDVDETIAWVNALEPGPELELFEGAGHFFHGRLVELRKAVEAFVEGVEQK